MSALTISIPGAPKPTENHHKRAVFGGHAYDTRTASMLYHWDYVWHLSPDVDAGHVGGNDITQTLYETTRGAYFLLVYNEMIDPWDAGYHEIRPVTRKEAIDWAEEHCRWMVEELFGRMPEPGEAPPYTDMTPRG